MAELEGRVAIVTGSSSGIGEAVARRFSEVGARVVVNSASLEVVEDLETGVTAASGGTVYADEQGVVAEGFQAVAVPDEIPDAEGGYEASKELTEGEED